MKRFSRRRIRSWLQSGPPAGVALVFGVLVFAGCGRSHPAAEAPAAIPAATNPAPAAANQPAYVPPAAPTTITAAPDGGADLKQLNQAYIGWIVQNRRRPKTFAEFITMSGMNVPPARAGKKYVIDKSGFINLADQ